MIRIKATQQADLDTGAVDNRRIGTMRLILAALALLIIALDPAEPDRLVWITYITLALYTLYSAFILALLLRSNSPSGFVTRWAHWIDVAWYTLLISLSSGTMSVFFFGFYFAILVASFQWGLAAGVRVTAASALLYGSVGYITTPQGPELELNRFLLRPVYLLVLGYMIAYWGGSELAHKRKLRLLKDVSTLSNPRFGVDRTINSLIRRLLTFYEASGCLFIIADPMSALYSIYDTRASIEGRPYAAQFQKHRKSLPASLVEPLPALLGDDAIIYDGKIRSPRWRRRKPGLGAYYAYNTTTGERSRAGQDNCKAVADMLGAESFMSVPIRDGTEPSGRLFIISEERGFNESDLQFLAQVIENVSPVIQNIHLVDRLASDAAENERQRIARDIHDSVIQPYIGLQMGIAAMHQRLTNGVNRESANLASLLDLVNDVSGDLEQLVQLTDQGIADLRGFLSTLTGKVERDGSLLPSVRRFSEKFSEATGVNVSVTAPEDISINDRLAAEVFQMVVEGLSNVRKHTQATHAAIRIMAHDDWLVLRVENDTTAKRTGDDADPSAVFTPRSIVSRAEALGGQAHVEQASDNNTAVVVEIPL